MLPRQRVGVHCERAALTESTSVPMAVRIGIGGERGPLKEDCSNKISAQGREKRDEGGGMGLKERLGKRRGVEGGSETTGRKWACWIEVKSF